MARITTGFRMAVATCAIAVSLSIATFAARAENAKLMLCSGCHGDDGISVSPEIPNLAGQKETYLANTLRAFRAGERTNPIMMGIAGDLSDADIEELARHFSSLLPAAGNR